MFRSSAPFVGAPVVTVPWKRFAIWCAYVLAGLHICDSRISDSLRYDASLGKGWIYRLADASSVSGCDVVSLTEDGVLTVTDGCSRRTTDECFTVSIFCTRRLPSALLPAEETVMELFICKSGRFGSTYSFSKPIRIEAKIFTVLDPPSDCLAPKSLTLDFHRYVPAELKWRPTDVAPPDTLVPIQNGSFVNSRELCFGEWGSAGGQGHLFSFALAYQQYEAIINVRIVGVTLPSTIEKSAERHRRAMYNPTAPYFTEKSYTASIAEEVPIGSEVTRVKAVDPDRGLAGLVRYSLEATVNQRSLTMFRIDNAGVVSVRGRIDREDMMTHNLVVRATDSDEAYSKTGSATLVINVLDINDNTPVFEYTVYEEKAQEIEPVESIIARVHATDGDSGSNGAIRYSIVNTGGANSDFAIDPESGEIKVARSLDRERTATYALTVEAVDQAIDTAARRSSAVVVTVKIMDYNDNSPVFSQSDYTFRVLENLDTSKEPIVIGLVKATDKDDGLNGLVRYSITVGNPVPSLFRIGNDNGQFMVLRPLDREQVSEYTLRIRAQDMANDTTPKSNVTTVKVLVIDVNDNYPVFKYPSFSFSVYENVPLKTAVGSVPATDADVGDNARLTYSIVSAVRGMPITIETSSGVMLTNGTIDRETVASYSFVVLAADSGTPSLSSSTSVTIAILDINDNVPSFSKAVYNAAISEDAQIGSEVVTIISLDPDENDVVTYSIISGDNNREFLMTREQSFGVIRVAKSLNYIRKRHYELHVLAQDTAKQNATCRVVVNVTGKNRFAPTFAQSVYSVLVSESQPVGTSVYTIVATDQDVEENGRVTYQFVQSAVKIPFRIDPDTGTIYVNGSLDRDNPATQSFELDLIAEDRGTPRLSSEPVTVHIRLIDVNDNAPVFERRSYAAQIPEDWAVGTSVIRISATDRDQPGTQNSRIRYAFAGGSDGKGRFAIEPATGVVRVNKELDRETAEYYNLTALAIDMGTPPKSTAVGIYLKILDVNDNAPVFESAIIIRRIRENVPVGTRVDGAVKATDADGEANALVVYNLIGGDRYAFDLVPDVGDGSFVLVTRVDLDYESPKKNYSLDVQAASQTLISKATVVVRLVDANDNAPQLRDFYVIVNNYRQHFPSEVGRVPAFDPDDCDKDNLRYSFKSGNEAGLLLLDAVTGTIRLNPHLDSDRPTLATLVVTVGDGLYNATARCILQVRLITEEMLNNSVTLRLENMTPMTFMTDMYTYFIDALSTVLQVEQDKIYVIDIQNDTEVLDPNHPVLNVSFCALISNDLDKIDVLFTQEFLKETIYLKLNHLKNQSALTVLPFDDTLCLIEPCVNFADCSAILQFDKAALFMSSNAMLFRPIRTKKLLTCHCPLGFVGRNVDYSCDVEVNYCYSNPCKHGGTCVQKEGGYNCLCPSWMAGLHCDIDTTQLLNSTNPEGRPAGPRQCTSADSIVDQRLPQACRARVASFLPGSYLMFPSVRRRYRFKVTLSFATRLQDGLLFYNGRYNDVHDYMALQLIAGNLVFSYSLGGDFASSKAVLTTDTEHGFCDGNWHNVTVEYLNKTVTISTGGDSCDVGVALLQAPGNQASVRPCAVRSVLHLPSQCMDSSARCYRFLDLTGPLMLGGLPPGVLSVPAVRTDSFSGCIGDVAIDGEFLNLSNSVMAHNVQGGCPYKEDFCASSPCVRGSCENGWLTFTCQCPAGYGGQTCQLSVDGPFSMFGTGYLRYRPVPLAISKPWFNGLAFVTSKSNGTLMKIQLSQGETVNYRIINGYVVCTTGGKQYTFDASKVNDGQWHNLEVKFDSDKAESMRLYFSLDFGQIQGSALLDGSKIVGLTVVDVLVGSDGQSGTSWFSGCVKGAQVGNYRDAFLQLPERTNAEQSCSRPNLCQYKGCPEGRSYCVDSWDAAVCRCRPGYSGPLCNSSVCSTSSPCQNGGSCSAVAATGSAVSTTARFGYKCLCAAGFAGDYCERSVEQVCPASWWGCPLCGPCRCDTALGFSSTCNVSTGECYCKDRFYSSPSKDRCLPCDCHWPSGGAESQACDAVTGQCQCHKGVRGRRCDECINPSAELIPSSGCEVQYDACPRARADEVWWPRTDFGFAAIADCPAGSQGRAVRLCRTADEGWAVPNLDNCTSDDFVELLAQLIKLEGYTGEHSPARQQLRLAENTYAYTFVAKRLIANLSTAATSPRPRIYLNDFDISQRAIKQILDRETRMAGLNLTHTKDRGFLYNLFTSMSMVADQGRARFWKRICEGDETSVSGLLLMMEHYAQNLAFNMATMFAFGVMHEFDLATPNIIFGLDTVVLDNSSRALIPKYNNYVQRPDMFDNQSFVSLPPSLFWLPPDGMTASQEPPRSARTSSDRAVVAYVFYRSLGDIMLSCQQEPFDTTVSASHGHRLTINSPVITLVGQLGNQTLAIFPDGREVVLTFKLLASRGRTGPRCVSWLHNAWSTDGCLLVGVTEEADGSTTFVKCACRRWGSYAVLMDVTNFMAREPLLLGLETYIAVPIGAVCLSVALSIVCCLNMSSGVRHEVSCTVPIRCNMLLSMLTSLLLYLVGIDKSYNELACTVIAIGLHFFVLASFFWLFVDLLHLCRTMAEAADQARNVDRGTMKFYYVLGYVIPSIIVSLSVGLDREGYGKSQFCWLSHKDSVFWSLAGPVICSVVGSLCMLVTGLRMSCKVTASCEQKRKATARRSQAATRSSIWSAIFMLPSVACLWVFAVLAANEDATYFHYAFAVFACTQGLYALLAYVLCSREARDEVRKRLSSCCCARQSEQRQQLGNQRRLEQLVNKQLVQLSALTCDSSLEGGLVDINLAQMSGPSSATQSQTDSILDHELLAYLNTDGSTSTPDDRRRFHHHHRRRQRRNRYFSDDSDSDSSSDTSSLRYGGAADRGDAAEQKRNRRHGSNRGNRRHWHRRRTRRDSSTTDGADHSTPSVQPHGVLPPPVHFMTPDAPPAVASDAECAAEPAEGDKLVTQGVDAASPVTTHHRVKRSHRQPYLKSFDFV